jgi:hypothetical protein
MISCTQDRAPVSKKGNVGACEEDRLLEIGNSSDDRHLVFTEGGDTDGEKFGRFYNCKLFSCFTSMEERFVVGIGTCQ